MPVTPLHYPVAYGLSKIDKRLSLPGLVVGSFMPDIEVPILWLFFSGVLPDHLVLHSFLGALTIGTILAVFTTRYLYTPIISWFFGVDHAKLDEACSLNLTLILSCILGLIGHLLLDYTMHWFNPLLWPWVDPFVIVGPLVLLFAPLGGLEGTPFHFANYLVSGIMILFWFLIIFKNRNDNLWESIWLGELPSPELKLVE
jgi:membrane-bound metal-dependent hydrolase YbcI (DUF457 family)